MTKSRFENFLTSWKFFFVTCTFAVPFDADGDERL